MKRIVISILCILTTIGMAAQQQEFIHLTTDKDFYLAGEDLWLKVSVNDASHRPMDLSKVAYIEVSDPNQVYAQAKIHLENGIGSGRIGLPRTMHSGTFQLTAYTRYQRNWGEEAFTRQYITIANTLQSSDEDSMEWTDSLPSLPSTASSTLMTDQKEYNRRSKVTLSWEDLPECISGFTLSVVRKDYALNPLEQPVAPRPTNLPKSYPWTAEMEGHLVSALVAEGSSNLKTARLACAGKDIRLFEGQTETEGNYTFYTHNINNLQDIALDAVPQERKEKSRLNILSPFVEKLPQRLPVSHLACAPNTLQERNVHMQLIPLLPASDKNPSAAASLFNFSPNISYNLDEWVRFTTVRETFIEFVLGVRVSKRDGETVLQTLKEETKKYSDFKALVLIDGIPVENHEQALNFDARLLQYIHLYQGGYTFGGQVYDGIISMITHKGTLSGLRLEENTSFLTYEFPQKDVTFPIRNYASEEEKASRIPDFRHTLYWNPCIGEQEQGISFYTSDWQGTYLVTLKGYTSDGKEWMQQTEFNVK